MLMLSAVACSHAAGLMDDTPAVLEQKVKQGDTAAMCELGNRLLRGRSGETNVPRGKELVMQSAQSGFAECQFYLGSMYKDNRWVGFSPELAVRWYTQAAEQGLAVAQLELGLAFEKGLGDMKQDEKQARSWLKRAALQGHAVAMYHYGRLLLPAERTEALAWLQLAGDKGDYDAQTLLAAHPLPQGSERLVYERMLIRLRSTLPKS